MDDTQALWNGAPEGGRRARNGPPKRIERRVKTRKTDDLNRFQKSRVNNQKQRAATPLKFNKFLGKSVADSDSRLERYFVDTHTFNVLSTGQRDIVAGDKGTGKTALYKILINRHRQSESLRTTEIIPAFNLTGSPVFQQLLTVPEQSEGQYIAFWKTYILALIGNWVVDNPSIVKQVALQRVEYFLGKNSLKTADVSPGNIFSRILSRFPKVFTPKAIEMEIGLSEVGLPKIKPRVEFSPPEAAQPTNFFGIDYIAGLKLLPHHLDRTGSP